MIACRAVRRLERLTLRRGGLYLPRQVCDRYFDGLETVVLLRQGDDLSILPVRHAAAGGYILKRRNLAGDRVVYAADFFRAAGLSDDVDCELETAWSSERGALIVKSAFLLVK